MDGGLSTLTFISVVGWKFPQILKPNLGFMIDTFLYIFDPGKEQHEPNHHHHHQKALKEDTVQ